MAPKFEDGRQLLLKECGEINSFDISDPELVASIWVDASASEKDFRANVELLDSSHLPPDADYRSLLRNLSSRYYRINFAFISRISLIQQSCSKILNSWNGVSSDINEFRYLIERYAVLVDLLNKVEATLGSQQVKTRDDLENLGMIVEDSGWTRFNWSQIPPGGFEEMGKADYEYDPDKKKELKDVTSKNIMSTIDRVERSRMKGLRAFYFFCCEFVHPNMGEIIGCSFDQKPYKAKDGDTLVRFSHSPLSTPVYIQGDSSFPLIGFSYIFAAEMLEDLRSIMPAMLKCVRQSGRVRKKTIHKLVKMNKQPFSKSDLCPCGSGKSLQRCL